jgi:hypothetical protein
VLALGEHGLWRIVPGEGGAEAAAVNQAMREAQRALTHAAEDAEAEKLAAHKAERVFESFFAAEQWTVRVRWGD